MSRISKLTDDFLRFFHDFPQNVFPPDEFDLFLKQLSRKTSIAPEKLFSLLKNQKHLTIAEFELPNGQQITLLAKPNATIYEIAVALKENAYISHLTAAILHGLTKQNSSLIYISSEQTPKQRKENTLEQESIDYAFSQNQRVSGRTYTYNDRTIILLNGMSAGREGVIKVSTKQPFPFTNIERTLIDVTVRPAYAGGAMAIFEMYKKALHKISFEELLGILNSISFIYPYHQSIGFYLQRAGYAGPYLNDLKKTGMQFDFYLDYNMPEKNYSKEWHVYYPAQMDTTG